MKWHAKWLSDNWRHDLTNAIIAAGVLAILTCAGYFLMRTLTSKPIWLTMSLGAIIGMIGGALYWIANKPEEPLIDQRTGTDQRPWISVAVQPSGELYVGPNDEIRMTFDFTLTNDGRLPAADVQIHVGMVQLFGDPRPDQKQFADGARKAPSEVTAFGSVLMPGKTMQQRITMGLTKEQVDTFWHKFDKNYQQGKDNPEELLLITVLGCIDYKFTFQSGHHQTPLAYELKALNEHNQWVAPSMKHLPIPLARLALIPSVGGMITNPPD